MVTLRKVCLDRRWEKDPVARKRVCLLLCIGLDKDAQEQVGLRCRIATELGVQKLVEITHGVVGVPAMKRRQGPTAPRMSCNTRYTEDKWPSDSIQACKDLTSVREPVETASNLSHLSLFLCLRPLHKSRRAVISQCILTFA